MMIASNTYLYNKIKLIQLGCSHVLEIQIADNFQASGVKDWSESY
jgi:hypothetical protein